jgi:hypothetical protein
LQGSNNRDRAQGHNLPDLKAKLANPPNDNQDENERQDYYWNHLLSL